MNDFVYYGTAVRDSARGEFDWDRVPLRAMLVDPRYQPDLERDENAFSLRHLETNGEGRTGGVRLVRPRDGGDGTVFWPKVTGGWRFVVLFREDTGGLLGYFDIGEQFATTPTDFMLDLNAPERPERIENVDDLLARIL